MLDLGVKEDRSVIEAALYASDRPLSLKEIMGLLGTSSETYTRKLLEAIKADYQKRGGPLTLQAEKGVYSIRLKEELLPKLERVIPKTKLSRGALKTLALIAYKQPIHQSSLAKLRGGRVYEQVKELIALGFVESKPFGRTRMLRTSKKFARYFGFEDDMDKIRERIEELLH